jgi:preprotein translocase subunit SecG
MIPVFINLLLVVHVIVSLLIILVVLMQRPKSEGLGAAFGGGMTDNLFGAQTTNVLQTFTRWLTGIFCVLTLLLSVLYAKQASVKSEAGAKLRAEPAVKPVAPSPSPAPAVSGSKANEATPAPSATATPASAAVEATPVPSATPQATATPAATAKPSPTAEKKKPTPAAKARKN